jgi:hypothetical protein
LDGYSLLVLAHVLLFVYWLGTDLGVFYVSFRVLNRELSVETRAQMAQVLLNLDLAPRICLVLIFPVGLTLAAQMGVVPLGGGWLAAVWVASLTWLAVVVTIHREHGSARGQVLAKGDTWFRGLLVVALLALVAWSLGTGEPFRTAWLAWKVGLYALAMACGLGIRIVLRSFGPALGALLAGDRSAENETRLAASLRRTYPLVWTIWAAVVAAAYLGIAKP